jgi:hypothetical protein
MNSTARPRHYIEATLILLVAVVMLLLAWPRLSASLSYLPVDTALARHWAGEPLPAAQLDLLAERARQSLGRHGHHRYHDGLSLLLYLRAQDATVPEDERREALQASLESAVEVISRAPMKPAAWLRIAAARASLRHPAEQVSAALKMSIYTGRVEPSLLPLRLQLGFSYLARDDAEAMSLLRDQVLLAWDTQPRTFIGSIRSGAVSFTAVENLLVGRHNDVLAQMEAALEKVYR